MRFVGDNYCMNRLWAACAECQRPRYVSICVYIDIFIQCLLIFRPQCRVRALYYCTEGADWIGGLDTRTHTRARARARTH